MKFEDFFPRKYLKASDLNDKDLTLTIQGLESEEFEDGAKPVLWFEDHPKALVLNRTNFSTIETLYGEDSMTWVGKRITLFECEISYRGDMMMAIRVRSKPPDTAPVAPITAPAAPKPAAVTEDDIDF